VYCSLLERYHRAGLRSRTFFNFFLDAGRRDSNPRCGGGRKNRTPVGRAAHIGRIAIRCAAFIFRLHCDIAVVAWIR
jgi:hypothetical protein